MRIAIDVRPLNDGRVTGVQVYILNLLKHLLDIDNENEYILFDNSIKRSDLSSQALKYAHTHKVKLKIFRFPSKLFNFCSKFLGVPKLDKLVGGADIFFFPRFSFGSVSKHCKKVVTMHDISFDLDPSLFSLRRKLWHKVVSDKTSVKKADELIAVSHSTKEDLIEVYGIDRQKVTVIPLGVDLGFYHPQVCEQDRRVAEKYGLKDGFILTLATLEPRKNILGTIRAFEQVRRVACAPSQLVIGGNLGWLYKDILSAISSSPYKQDIKLVCPVLEQEKPSLYRLAKVLSFPSFYEGFGLPPLEAAACGTPSILAMNSSLPEVLGNCSIYVNPYRTDQIVAAILELCSREELYKEKSAAGRLLAQNFNWHNTAKATVSVFDKLKKR